MRSLMSPYSAKFADSATRELDWARCAISNQGAPMAMPSALASFERAMAQPSLFESTTTGWPTRLGRNTRSQLT